MIITMGRKQVKCQRSSLQFYQRMLIANYYLMYVEIK